jgi:hypothetical protein
LKEEDRKDEVTKVNEDLLPLSHPHYLSPSFLPVILTTSPSFIPFNPPPHYLSSLSCNIIVHLITSVFLPDDGEELGRESIWKRMEIVRRIMMRK